MIGTPVWMRIPYMQEKCFHLLRQLIIPTANSISVMGATFFFYILHSLSLYAEDQKIRLPLAIYVVPGMQPGIGTGNCVAIGLKS